MTRLGSVLVVDDEVELRTALCEALDNSGYETCGLGSGAEALIALQEREFDLLLLDMMMLEMDGIEFLKKAIEIDPYAVGIIMTGYGSIQTAVEAMKLGAFDYLLKPFKLNVLLQVMFRAMEMRRLKNENLQLRESMAIYNLIMNLTVKLDINAVLNKIADAVLDQCDADEMSIMLPTGRGELYVAIARGEHPEGILAERFPLTKGIAGWVFSNRETLLLQGQINDPRFAPIKQRPEIKSSISMPLILGGNCVGVLNVNSTRRSAFPIRKIKLLNIIASTVASSLENARLYAELKETEENYRSIFENSIEGIFRITRDGRYSMVNPSMAHILGYDTPGEVVSLSSNIDYSGMFEGHSEIQGIERQVCRKDGTVVWVLENVRAVYDDDGDILYFEGTAIDITEHKAMQKEFERLDRLNLIGEMAASIGHEIRNPMTAVRGFLQMLSMKDSYKKDYTYFELMIEELDRANSIISEYLGMAKNKIVDLTSNHLDSIVSSLYPIIKADANYQEMDVKLDLGNPPLTLIDEKEIRQMILNLVRNGLEAMLPGKTLTIGTMVVEDEIILYVKDEGHGLDPKIIDMLGTPFLTTKENGTGLGLAVCYSIAARHSAKIEVITGSEGTTFRVHFPKVLEQMRLF